ncbi:acyltransferase [Terriglobus sp. TAA 43]|uniref:acyltransferase family protein n=1 Tax=Terriglobus sp. TAA 43 TaxID=278961 RepID=UPI00064563CE|nr:acyltransferase [Terriglobus sp. TAA 43]
MSQEKTNTGEIARQHDLDALTGLRFFAALSVFAAHFFVYELWFAHPSPAISSIRNGFTDSVYVFFVLSGFILTIAYERMESSAPDWDARKKFWIARFARMYPVYLLAFAWFAPFILHHRFLTEPTGLATRKAVGSGLASVFLVQSWISDRFAVSWNGPAWTLSIETGFYLMFPWLLRGIVRLGTAGLVALGAVMCLLAGWAYGLPPILDNHARNPVTMLPVFVLGIIAARLYLRWHSLPQARFAILLPIPAVLYLTVANAQWLPSGVLPNTAKFLSIVCLIYGLASRGWPSRLLSRPIMVLLGEASYSFYLLQLAVYYSVLWVWLRFSSRDLLTVTPGEAPQQHWWGFLLLLAINQAVALLAFIYIERPLRITLRNRLGIRFVKKPLPRPAVM